MAKNSRDGGTRPGPSGGSKAPRAIDTLPQPPKATGSPGRTSPAKHKAFAWCETANQIEAGAVSSETPASNWHHRCPGVTSGRNSSRCACGCHQAPTRCYDCGSEESVIDPRTLRCLDPTHCAERAKARREAHPTHQAVAQALAASRAANSTTSTEPRAPRVDRPTSGRCVHCGDPTKGGLFIPGHDAKLKGDLKRAAAGDGEPAVVAMAERILRHWDHMTDRQMASWDAALALTEEMDGAAQTAWLAQVVSTRIGAE